MRCKPGLAAVYQKQKADGFVTQCAQRHERGDFSDALELCADALDIYILLNGYTKLVPGFTDGLFWADIAQTTVVVASCSSAILFCHWFSEMPVSFILCFVR